MLLSEERLDRESWEEMVRKGRQSIEGLYPGWTDYNLHDPGITIMELMAWFKEIQMFHMDQAGEAHRRKYLKLLGVRLGRKRPGHVWITVSSLVQMELIAGTRFWAGRICFETAKAQTVAEGIFYRFVMEEDDRREVLKGQWLCEGKGLRLYPFGMLPKAGNRFIICLSEALQPGNRYCLYLENSNDGRKGKHLVEEAAYDGYGFYPLAVMCVKYLGADGWEECLIEEDQTYGMCQSGGIYFEVKNPMNLVEPQLSFTLKRCDYAAPPVITRISMAMVEAWQQETRPTRPVFFGNGFPDQCFDLEEPCIDRSKIRLMEMSEGGKLWEVVEDFDCSAPEDRHYTLEGGVLNFGDCIHGRAPEGRMEVTQYVRTLGVKGNIKSGAITVIEGSTEGGRERASGESAAVFSEDMIRCVVNEKDVTGAADDETTEDALSRYLGEGGELRRAVTLSDYEALVGRTPGLFIEECRAYSLNPSANRITIAVRPYSTDGCGMVNRAYEKNLYRYLEEKRLIGTKISVISPEYVYVTVTCCVVGKVKYRDVRERVEYALRARFAGKTFGDGISYGVLHGYIDSLACVRMVKSLWIDSDGRGRRSECGDLGLPPNGLIRLKEVCCVCLIDTEEKM